MYIDMCAKIMYDKVNLGASDDLVSSDTRSSAAARLT